MNFIKKVSVFIIIFVLNLFSVNAAPICNTSGGNQSVSFNCACTSCGSSCSGSYCAQWNCQRDDGMMQSGSCSSGFCGSAAICPTFNKGGTSPAKQSILKPMAR